MIGTTYRKLIDIRKQHKASQQILMVYATKPTNVFFCAGLIQIRCCTFLPPLSIFFKRTNFFCERRTYHRVHSCVYFAHTESLHACGSTSYETK